MWFEAPSHSRFVILDLSFLTSYDRSSVNRFTNFDNTPPLGPSNMIQDVLARIVLLRQRFGTAARIVLGNVNVQDALRQIRDDPAGTPCVWKV